MPRVENDEFRWRNHAACVDMSKGELDMCLMLEFCR